MVWLLVDEEEQWNFLSGDFGQKIRGRFLKQVHNKIIAILLSAVCAVHLIVPCVCTAIFLSISNLLLTEKISCIVLYQGESISTYLNWYIAQHMHVQNMFTWLQSVGLACPEFSPVSNSSRHTFALRCESEGVEWLEVECWMVTSICKSEHIKGIVSFVAFEILTNWFC